MLKVAGAEFRADASKFQKGIVRANKGQSKSKLEALHAVLKRDQVEAAQSLNSQNQGSTQSATAEEKDMMHQTEPNVGLQNHAFGNALGDYTTLTKQFASSGFKSSAENSFVISTLDSRRNIDRITDQSSDGYSMLSNSFGLHTLSEKSQKKASKNPKLSSTALF